MDRYLGELLPYLGKMVPRGEVILDLKASGMDDRCIDRYHQGMELRQRLASGRHALEPLTTNLP